MQSTTDMQNYLLQITLKLDRPSKVLVILKFFEHLNESQPGLVSDYVPSVTVRSEHHAAVLCDADDAVLRLDGHPTQLDVLWIGWAHTSVLLEAPENDGHIKRLCLLQWAFSLYMYGKQECVCHL